MGRFVIGLVLLAVVFGGFLVLSGKKPQGSIVSTTPVPTSVLESGKIEEGMKIQSSAFEHNQSIPRKFTCDGENFNPPLTFSDVPKDSVSLALIMDDPDAPRGLWVHWTVWNISPQTTSVEENSKFEGAVEGVTSFGKPGYGGPCPPDREHRYFFKLYALATKLSLDRSATKKELEREMEGHIKARAELVGRYNRQ